MIVCHCNRIAETDIEEAVRSLLGADHWQMIAPAQIQHVQGQRGRCCGCYPNLAAFIVRVTEAVHRNIQAQQDMAA